MNNLVVLSGKKMKSELDRQSLKQWWVAEQVGVHKTTVHRWLRADRTKIPRTQLEKLGACLCVRVESLVPLATDL